MSERRVPKAIKVRVDRACFNASQPFELLFARATDGITSFELVALTADDLERKLQAFAQGIEMMGGSVAKFKIPKRRTMSQEQMILAMAEKYIPGAVAAEVARLKQPSQ